MTETPEREPTLTMVDGRDALAYVIIKPNGDEGVLVDAGADGISKAQAAWVLRHLADQWDPKTSDEQPATGPTP